MYFQYGLDDRTVHVQFLEEVQIFLFTTARPSLLPVSTGAYFLGSKAAGA
jgi:hypothetical protein